MSSKEIAPSKLAESIATMVTAYVEGGLRMKQDWRPGLARIIQLRIARLLPDQPASKPMHCELIREAT